MISINNKFKKISKKELDEIIGKYISRQIYISFNISDTEEFRQIYINGEYIPYLISSHGRLFSLYYKGSKTINVVQMKTNIGKHGYERITLSYKGSVHSYQIHVLVALAFIKNNKPERTQVNHKDGIKTHNYMWNLEWCTPKENAIHAETNGLRKHAYGINHGSNIYSEYEIHHVCQLLEENNHTIAEISKLTKVSTKMIYIIYKRKAWTSISDDYDIDNFDHISTVDQDNIKNRYNMVRQVCKLLEENEYTMKDISKITGIKYKLVNQIYHKQKYLNIVSEYNFDNYDKFKITRNKK